jgi:Icc-related predicted phosphoesterase
MKILFIADIHGSTNVFNKALDTAKEYSIDLLIVGGDLCGKKYITYKEQNNLHYLLDYHENTLKQTLIKDVTSFINSCELSGSYPILLTEDELLDCINNPDKSDLFIQKAIESRFKKWVSIMNIIPRNFKTLFSPGNDDLSFIDSFFRKNTNQNILYGVDECIDINNYTFINYSIVTPSPWKTTRELKDNKIQLQLKRIISKSTQKYPFNKLIFNFHCPPYGTILDMAPTINSKFELKVEAGSVKKEHIGSKSIYSLIKEYQPIVSLHGHVHESQGFCNIDKTLCINPGSEYGQGILRGYIIEIEKDKVINHFRIER